ncbi:helix-turn-helix domain-containing protein [Amycolatopsis albispora]|uniref:Transcriptional regulator n=1 Tax=Amycolatopsis albispora TaxID=1804986 RepID=A0A344L899_9PSEU|nr:helix-turn-helix domain-containing protein [Amycolatopsis albispora]AXB44273.1 transcriptional regulator [Amycolatopsis albispora]
MPEPAEHPLVTAIAPLLDRIDATVVAPADRRPEDVPLHWAGELVGAVRLPGAELTGALERLVHEVETELGAELHRLDRAGKQRAVRLLEERGAFTMRKAVATIAESLGVTRFTVYNYLNRDHNENGNSTSC